MQPVTYNSIRMHLGYQSLNRGFSYNSSISESQYVDARSYHHATLKRGWRFDPFNDDNDFKDPPPPKPSPAPVPIKASDWQKSRDFEPYYDGDGNDKEYDFGPISRVPASEPKAVPTAPPGWPPALSPNSGQLQLVLSVVHHGSEAFEEGVSTADLKFAAGCTSSPDLDSDASSSVGTVVSDLFVTQARVQTWNGSNTVTAETSPATTHSSLPKACDSGAAESIPKGLARLRLRAPSPLWIYQDNDEAEDGEKLPSVEQVYDVSAFTAKGLAQLRLKAPSLRVKQVYDPSVKGLARLRLKAPSPLTLVKADRVREDDSSLPVIEQVYNGKNAADILAEIMGASGEGSIAPVAVASPFEYFDARYVDGASIGAYHPPGAPIIRSVRHFDTATIPEFALPSPIQPNPLLTILNGGMPRSYVG
ncbi:hypothetical protein DFP72DRAFT_1133987 [Ephemerocybe angulata]|uniref:Uncharacterized protein n=1 Tax=Ephemerocybe angulata TaxID=980116 RepID=A0A8H6HTV2_9AGAR|nr:hypothetical protein DFP72DRAFT_1133987 [Tulosesus angulatus]